MADNFLNQYRDVISGTIAGKINQQAQKAAEIESKISPEQKLTNAINAYNNYQTQMKNSGGIIGTIKNLNRNVSGGLNDATELSLRNNVIEAYNDYNNWKKEQDETIANVAGPLKQLISKVQEDFSNWEYNQKQNQEKKKLQDEDTAKAFQQALGKAVDAYNYWKDPAGHIAENTSKLMTPWDNDSPSELSTTSNGLKLGDAIRRNSELATGLIDVENGLNKPQNEDGFLNNYRKTTRQLGSRANTENIDSKTQSIMRKLWLPTYYDSLSDEMIEKYKTAYEKNPEATQKEYQAHWDKWNEDNYKYRIRAAQVLKDVSTEERQKILYLLHIEPMTGKAKLDKLIQAQDEKENEAIKKIASPFVDALRSVNENVANAVGKLFTKDNESTETGEDTDTSSDAKDTTASTTTESKSTFDPNDAISYTYKPGDTFGQVIKNLGLQTSNGLWGPNGDVEYYTQQLIDQGVWPDGVRGNIPIGTTIKLTKRK